MTTGNSLTKLKIVFRLKLSVLLNFIKSLKNACSNGKVWSPCQSCQITCSSPTCKNKDFECRAGCQCPPNKPFLHNGTCITAENCPVDYQSYQCGRSGIVL